MASASDVDAASRPAGISFWSGLVTQMNYLDIVCIEVYCVSSICNRIAIRFELDVCLHTLVRCALQLPIWTYQSTIAEKRGIFVVLFYCLCIEIHCTGPVMLCERLVAFIFERCGGVDV